MSGFSDRLQDQLAEQQQRTNTAVGARVRSRRIALKLTPSDVTAAADIDPKTLQGLEEGLRWPIERSRRRLEPVLKWKPGALDALKDGREPEELIPEASPHRTGADTGIGSDSATARINATASEEAVGVPPIGSVRSDPTAILSVIQTVGYLHLVTQLIEVLEAEPLSDVAMDRLDNARAATVGTLVALAFGADPMMDKSYSDEITAAIVRAMGKDPESGEEIRKSVQSARNNIVHSAAQRTEGETVVRPPHWDRDELPPSTPELADAAQVGEKRSDHDDDRLDSVIVESMEADDSLDKSPELPPIGSTPRSNRLHRK